MTYFGGFKKNIYLHNNILQYLVKLDLIFFSTFQMKFFKDILKIFWNIQSPKWAGVHGGNC
jgi:hypothetical protein